MPRKKGRTVGTRTLIVRLGERQDDDLRAAAEGLGLDVSNLVRLIFTEQLPAHRRIGRRGRQAHQAIQAAQARVGREGRVRGFGRGGSVSGPLAALALVRGLKAAALRVHHHERRCG